jgi:hypothetical protein
LKYRINGYHRRSYTQSKNDWSDHIWDSIDWEAFGRFFKRLIVNEQSSHTTIIFDQRSIGTKRHRTARVQDPQRKLCPCCQLESETPLHVYHCTQNPARMESILKLQRQLRKGDNHPSNCLLCDGVCNWLRTPKEPFTPTSTGYPMKFP